MNKLLFTALLFILAGNFVFGQSSAYEDSIKSFQKNYVESHEVVKGADRFLFDFFKPDIKYRVLARFEKNLDSAGFIMKTSGKKFSKYFRYGKLHFTLDQTAFELTVYQSEQLMGVAAYKNYLFVPYTDLTSGEESYAGGKYLAFIVEDIKNNTLLIDFNKAYNPYCAYATGYNCPIPPAENDLAIAIKAGEKNFTKKH